MTSILAIIGRTSPNQLKCSPVRNKTFSQIFIAFLKSIWNFKHFERKGEPYSLSICSIIDSKRYYYLTV